VPVPEALVPFVESPARAGLFVDLDGSLAPIVRDPTTARILPAARDALARLAEDVARVVVVSGRPVAFLAGQLTDDRILLAGAYGLERVVDGSVVVDERAQPYVDAVRQAADAADVELAGLRVERKGTIAVTLHWREHPERGTEAIAWANQTATRLGLAALPGRKAIELRPPVPVDKGTVVAELARDVSIAAFAGDDAGDLPAFATMRALAAAGDLDHAVTIGVTSAESPPEIAACEVVVDGPAGFAGLLTDLADAISARA
jgi:trehalose 6-phosphate phosphatase